MVMQANVSDLLNFKGRRFWYRDIDFCVPDFKQSWLAETGHFASSRGVPAVRRLGEVEASGKFWYMETQLASALKEMIIYDPPRDIFALSARCRKSTLESIIPASKNSLIVFTSSFLISDSLYTSVFEYWRSVRWNKATFVGSPAQKPNDLLLSVE
jgi:hypothetical protein